MLRNSLVYNKVISSHRIHRASLNKWAASIKNGAGTRGEVDGLVGTAESR